MSVQTEEQVLGAKSESFCISQVLSSLLTLHWGSDTKSQVGLHTLQVSGCLPIFIHMNMALSTSPVTLSIY